MNHVLLTALSSILLASTLNISLAYTDSAAVSASSKKSADSKKASSSKKSGSKKAAADNDGIAPSVRAFINKGQWPDAIAKLEELTASDTTAGRNEAWLAFCYLYTGAKDKIGDLNKKVKAMSVDDKDKNAPLIVEGLTLTTQGKLDDAEKLLNSIAVNDDALLEFSRACVALKKGNAASAAEYCERVVGLCPNFAWGYRTLGFIQEKSLKNPQLAERAYVKSLSIEPDSTQVRNLLIDIRLAKNDFDGAIDVARTAIQDFPHDAANYYRLAQIYQQQWRLIEALEQLNKSVSIDANEPRYYRAMATIYRYQGKLQEAINEQQHAVELSKKDQDFELVELANLQELNQNTSKAVESLQQALKIAPSNAVADQKLVALLKKEGRNDELIAEYKRVIELQPKVSSLRLNLADAYRHAGKTDEAIEQLKEAANLDQKDPRPHRAIAKIELEKKNYGAAAKSYIRALNINPASVEDLVALGFCYANNYDYVQAETAFTTGIALQQLGQSTGNASQVNPNDIMRSLASVFFSEGRYRESVVTLEGVVLSKKEGKQKKLDQFLLSEGKALRDRNADSFKELQKSFDDMDHEDQLSSLDDYVLTLQKLNKKEFAIEVVKKFPEGELKEKAPLVLATMWMADNRTRESKDLINAVIEKSKADAADESTAYLALAKAMQKDNDRKSAGDALQKAVELNPKDFQALVDLGRFQLSEKKYSEAQQAAQKALEVNPYCVPAFILLAENYAAQDKLKDAESNFLKATELYPTSIDAHKGLLGVFQKESKTAEAQREQEIINNLSKNG